jgi:hypothetical protein
MATPQRGIVPAVLANFAARLRFPQLFAFTATLFVLDLLIPDLIPFMDELLLGLVTLLFGMWRKDKEPAELDKPPIKDITPPSS